MPPYLRMLEPRHFTRRAHAAPTPGALTLSSRPRRTPVSSQLSPCCLYAVAWLPLQTQAPQGRPVSEPSLRSRRPGTGARESPPGLTLALGCWRPTGPWRVFPSRPHERPVPRPSLSQCSRVHRDVGLGCTRRSQTPRSSLAMPAVDTWGSRVPTNNTDTSSLALSPGPGLRCSP